MTNMPEEMYKVKYKKTNCRLILCALTTSLVFIISGIIVIVLRRIAYDRVWEENLTLTPNGKSYDVFKKTPFDVYFDIYFFNWTNPHEFYISSKKPIVEEVGPFRFLEVLEKTNVTFHENNTVSFNRTRRWFFVEDQSAFNLDIQITTINPIIVSGGYSSRYESFFMKKGFSLSLNAVLGRIDTTKSAREMLFEGYEDPIIELAKKIPFAKKRLPPFDKFGWFYQRNGSNTFDGHFNMGVGPHTRLGELYNWNYWNHTHYYPRRCGDVRGAAGEFYPQNLTKTPLELFNTEMCRTIVLDYAGETTSNLINAYTFTVGHNFLDNGTLIPGNECYCTGDCVPYGMMNVSSCRYGAPGFVSLPHFYKADPYYINLVEGLKPSDRHDFRLIVEPVTGIPLEVAARLQLNLLVKPISGVSLLEDINEVFFPVLWFEQVVEIPMLYSLGLLIFLWLKEICLAVGTLSITTGVSILCYTVYVICTTPICTSEDTKFIVKELVPLNQEKDR